VTRQVVTATRRPHEWRREGPNWKCSVCGSIAMEFDDRGRPEPYGTVYYSNYSGVSGLGITDLTCEEMAVYKTMAD
jgi:hypothetical protein